MNTKLVSEVVLHKFNGFEDTIVPKTVEIDGKKFLADETDPTKPKLGDDQKPVPFVEQKKVEAINPDDLGKMSLSDLAKLHPELAGLLDKDTKRSEADTKAETERKEKEEKEAAEKGQWKELAEKRGSEHETTKQTLVQKEEQLGKYVETTKAVLEGLLKTIPKENLSLIPSEFSPRQKLEYIIANAERLGAKVNAAGGKIDKSDITPAGTDEDKLVARMTELQKKATDRTATPAELAELRQVGIKITELRREAQNKKA